ncbi:MAG: exodeoxyribonuclease VII large subunit, partial [Lachnospiraceae bacterium]|nr:exodeoxyribonuclease VII large subunit [Lachnospiraceae bacterium]
IRDGIGALNERYEQLKKQLEEEGLFDEMYKQPIPKYIRTLGVVTAPTGAAVQDIMNIALRRNPWLRIILFPAIVQGDAAKNSIVSGIRAFNSMPEKERPEVIIIGRGGGSLEDLWAFNEEAVARAVFDSEIPIISAVGHETDTVITDYVADLRAPTPSAAAELAVDETERLLGTLEQYRQSLTSAMEARTERVRMRLRSSELLLSRLSPSYRIREQRMRLTQAEDALGERMRRIVEDRRHRAEKAALMLDALSPLKRLSGGYGYVTGGDGRPLTRISGVRAGDSIAVRLRDGRIGAKVTEAVPDVE